MNKKKNFLKILFVGESNVGKTSLIFRYTEKIFTDDIQFKTIGVEFITKTIDIDGDSVKMQIWDTSGDERFRNLIIKCYDKSDGICVVFDITKKDTFLKAKSLIESINENSNKFTIFLIGNKCDLQEREVTKEEAEEFASKQSIHYFETSAKSDICVDEMFSYLLNQVFGLGKLFKNESLDAGQNEKKNNVNECLIE